MRIQLFLIAMLLVNVLAFGQLANLPGNFEQPLRETISGKNVIGERFFQANYKSGVVYDTDGKEYQVFLRYDKYKDEIEVFNDNTALVLQRGFYPSFRLDYFDEVTQSREIATFRSGFNIEGFKPNNYFQVIDEEESAVLLKSNRVTFEEFTKSEYGGGNETYRKYEDNPKYFLYFNDGQYIELINHRKKIHNSFPNYQSELQSFIKDNKFKFRDEQDFRDLVEYYLDLT